MEEIQANVSQNTDKINLNPILIAIISVAIIVSAITFHSLQENQIKEIKSVAIGGAGAAGMWSTVDSWTAPADIKITGSILAAHLNMGTIDQGNLVAAELSTSSEQGRILKSTQENEGKSGIINYVRYQQTLAMTSFENINVSGNLVWIYGYGANTNGDVSTIIFPRNTYVTLKKGEKIYLHAITYEIHSKVGVGANAIIFYTED